MIAPKRIQRRRTKGWKMPDNTVSICRPGKFGNPFKSDGCREAGFTGTDLEIKKRCVETFRAWLVHPDWRINWDGKESETRRQAILDSLPDLRGKDVACFCPTDQPCHGDVLLTLANATLPFDCWRCQGVVTVSGQSQPCRKRNSCVRFLARNHCGDRTVFGQPPASGSSLECSEYVELT